MSRTKKIYFLSAFVVIIGCFALNQSYSLFTATAESDSIESTVPKLDVSLSLYSITIEAGKEYLIKQTVTNNSVIPINYGISTNNVDNVSIAKHDSIPNNVTYGIKGDTDTSLASNTSKDIYLIVSNSEGTTDLTVNFTLNKNYTTITTTSTNLSNITTEEEVLVEESSSGTILPYNDEPDTLKSKIIENFANSNLYSPSLLDETVATEINIKELMTSKNKVIYPVLTGTYLLDVPSPTEFDGFFETEEVGLYKTEDDYGMSYYFRGASNVNYVNFAGYTWRIVRINGDGSIRLILNDYIKDSSGNILKGKFNEIGSNAYVGYMYGSLESTNYDETHRNENNSIAKTQIDDWYGENIENDEKNIHYQEYLADTLFCGDKSYSTDEFMNELEEYDDFKYRELGYKFYAGVERVGVLLSDISVPSLKCVTNDTGSYSNNAGKYSRYTSKIDMNTVTNLGVEVNNDLDYPIGLISADEVAFAGDFYGTYLFLGNGIHSFTWTMTPSVFDGDGTTDPYIFASYSGLSWDIYANNNTFAYRPVINLRADLLWSGGDGSSGTPYEVSLPN